jgi:hypothetical protein
MRTNPSPAALWARSAPEDLAREPWMAALLLVGIATLFALYVIVLEHDVRHARVLRMQAHARAVAEADCEVMRPGESRAACLALLPGGPVRAVAAAGAPPENNLSGAGARLATASLNTVGAQ